MKNSNKVEPILSQEPLKMASRDSFYFVMFLFLKNDKVNE